MKSGKLDNWLIIVALLLSAFAVPAATAVAIDEPDPALAAVSGHGEWLYQAAAGVEMETNGGGKQLAYPAAYRWQPDAPAAALNILIYAADSVHQAPNTFLDQALQALGLAYTAHYNGDFSGFEVDLSGGAWDLVLFGQDLYGAPESVFTALNNYVAGGGKLVLHTWQVSSYLANPLWSTLGFAWVSNDTDPPDPVYWWQPDHPIFRYPESVPELTVLNGGIYGIYGQHVEPLAGAEAVAGYTTPGPDPDEAAIVLANDNRTVFRGFLDGQNSADLDGDTVLDGVELWINLIAGIQVGFGPTLSVTPDSLTADLVLGMAETRQLTLTNAGTVPALFEISEQDRGFELGRASVTGHGEWLYQAAAGVEMETNGRGKQLAYPQAYRWQPDAPTAALNILIYADDLNHPVPNTYLDQALQALGLGYTAYYSGDWAGFETALTGGGWDLVLFGNDEYSSPESVFTALNNYVTGGGKLVCHSWRVDGYPAHPLWSTLGFTWVADDTDPPDPVYWWQPDHGIFTTPQWVPEFTALTTVGYGVYGQHVEPLPGPAAVAGYTTPGPDPDEAAIVLANDNRTVFRGFLDGQNSADLDGDTVPDGVELWINLIDGIQYGFLDAVPWLSEWPLGGPVSGGGGQVVVDVTFDAGAVAQPGEYWATLDVRSNDLVKPIIGIPVTMTVSPPPDWGKLAGTVTSLGYCDGESYPLEGAMVVAHGGGTITLTTNISGEYSVWLQAGTYQVNATAAGHADGAAQVIVTAQQTTTQDLALRLLEPCMSLTPPALEATLLSGTSETQVLTLIDDGAAPSEFRMIESGPVTPRLARATGRVYAASEAKEAVPAARGSGPLAAGRPDPFGYTYADSNELDGPSYAWIEIAPPAGGSGVSLGMNGWDDAYYWPLDLPWAFTFYGTDYTQLAVASNGTVYFENAYLGLGNVPIPGANSYGVNTFIAHWWDDMYITPGDVYYQVEDDRVIIEYYQTSGCCLSPDYATWEVILFQNGNILMQYQDTNLGDSRSYGAQATVGIQKDTTTGLQCSYNAPSLTDSLAICFAYPGHRPDCQEGDIPWLVESPITGTVPADGQGNVEVTFTAIPTMPLGTYAAALVVVTDDAQNPLFHVPVTLNIVSCVQVTGVDLTVVTADPIFPGDAVHLEAGIGPYNVSLPYSYAVDYGDGTPPVTGVSSDDPLALNHSYAAPGTYTVTLSVWNCNPAEPVAATALVEIGLRYVYLPLVVRNH
jgi:hypothetical protein